MDKVTFYAYGDTLRKSRQLQKLNKDKIKTISSYFNNALRFYNTYIETGHIMKFCEGGEKVENDFK